MAFRFVHAADIHLDSPLLSLEEYPGAPVEEIRLATRKALGKLVDFSIEREAAFVIIAGDRCTVSPPTSSRVPTWTDSLLIEAIESSPETHTLVVDTLVVAV